ncbi:MAG: ammonium transporter [Pirellulaceae bacterium]|nr:ammonium transporter [Pirellulaceae bacterium]
MIDSRYRAVVHVLATFFCLGFVFSPTLVLAEETPTLSAGDTAWVLTSTALVLFMTIPGLALFYGGLVKSRNVLSLLMQCLSLTAVLSLIWAVCGYSLAFETTGMVKGELNLHSFIGGLSQVGLKGVTPETLKGTIPEYLFAAYQMTFAVITPALMIGAFAERMRFSAVLWFSSLWLLVVYVPICHMTWAGDGGLFANWGVMDFAGGIVVHITAGCSALVACIVVGPRTGYPAMRVPPHNMTMTFTGTAMLWVGWFGFNAGSALAANGTAASALFMTHISACAATVVWMAIEWIKLGKPGVLGAATGSIAGLAAITPASGYVGPLGAIAIGATSAIVCFIFSTAVKKRFRYDDSLDVFGVHGVGGIIGTVMVGLFAASVLGGVRSDLNIGHQLYVQIAAAAIAAVYSMIATYVLLKLTQMAVGLRVKGQDEQQGLDLAEHEERGYSY